MRWNTETVIYVKKNCLVYIQRKGDIVVVDIKQHKSQFTNSNFTITQSAKFFWHCVMVMFEFCKLWFVLFYIYNHDVTFTLYINWTVFYINICSFIAVESNLELNKIEQ